MKYKLKRFKCICSVQLFFLQVNNKIILKSGTDFREFSALTLTQESKEVNVDIKKVVVDSSFEPDAELKEALTEFEGESCLAACCLYLRESYQCTS